MKRLFVLFVLFVSAIQLGASESWYWTWTCNTRTEQCEKSALPVVSNLSSPNAFVSQHVCRLVCGKFGALWPLPTISTSIGDELIHIHPSGIKYNLVQSTEVSLVFFNEITSIFNTNIIKECGEECTISSNVSVTVSADVASLDLHLHPDTDESYTLKVATNAPNVVVEITSETLFGARHALETLSQLIASYKLSDHVSGRKVGLAMVADAKIIDKPIFKHRGLLIDTGRNYLPIHSIKKQVDALAASKMNVLHWHATDSQSFPIASKRVPELAKYGAYSATQVYHLSDITSLILYSLHRGVRVIFEVDAPSHAGNGWQWGPAADQGNLAVCVNQKPWRQFCIQPPCGQLNPANKNVYYYLEELYKDLVETGVTSGEFHMGGDEVFINCWNTTEEIITYMEKKGWGRNTVDFFKLWSEFQENNLQAFDSVVRTNTTPIILWSSALTEPDNIEKYLPKNRYIIQTWVETTNDLTDRLLEKGYRLIITTKNAWYLDHGFWGSTKYYDWRTVYLNKVPRHKGVLGGEACMWGEYVTKSTIDGRIWPRVAGVAERLWSDPTLNTVQVETRFYRHRDRLVTRGIAADAVAPGWCVLNEGECR